MPRTVIDVSQEIAAYWPELAHRESLPLEAWPQAGAPPVGALLSLRIRASPGHSPRTE